MQYFKGNLKGFKVFSETQLPTTSSKICTFLKLVSLREKTNNFISFLDGLGLIAPNWQYNMSNSSYTIYQIIINQPSNASNWTLDKCLMVLLPEMPALPMLGLSIYVMNKGVEIGHPVYSVLFLNLIFAFGMSIFLLLASIFCDIYRWALLSSVGNMIARLYHHSSWAVLSVLRY